MVLNEYEADKLRQQNQWEARQELDKQLAIKRDRKLIRKQEQEMELKYMQKTDEIVKKSNETNEKAKQHEMQQQKQFLQVCD